MKVTSTAFLKADSDKKPPSLFLWLGQGWPPARTQTARPGESSHPETTLLSPALSVFSDNAGKEKRRRKQDVYLDAFPLQNLTR